MPEVRANKWWKEQFPLCNIFFPEVECYLQADAERKDELAYGSQCYGMHGLWCAMTELHTEEERDSWVRRHLQKTNPKVAEEEEESCKIAILGEQPAKWPWQY